MSVTKSDAELAAQIRKVLAGYPYATMDWPLDLLTDAASALERHAPAGVAVEVLRTLIANIKGDGGANACTQATEAEAKLLESRAPAPAEPGDRELVERLREWADEVELKWMPSSGTRIKTPDDPPVVTLREAADEIERLRRPT